MTDNPTNVKTFGNPPIPVQDVVDADGNTYCQVHTDVETGLRCNNCGRLMCAKCARQTPVGYRCEQCVRHQESRFFNADASYYAKLFAVTALLSVAGAFVANLVGWFIFVFFVAAAAGGLISEAAARVTKGQRGRYAGPVAAGGVVAGVLILAMIVAGTTTAQITSANQLSPQMIDQLTEQHGAEEVQELLAQQASFGMQVFFQLFGRVLLSISMLLYTVITAATVYGRLNLFGRRR